MKRTYVVWEVEYPEEGSWEVKARTKREAIAFAAKEAGASRSAYAADLLTPEIAKARRAAEETR